MSKSKLILPQSGLAIPKSAAPAPEAESSDLQVLVEQAGRGLFSVIKMLEADEGPLPIALALADVQGFVAEALRLTVEEIRDLANHT